MQTGIHSSTDPLAPLLELIRKVATEAALEATRLELLRTRQALTAGPRLLSLAAISREYHVGRLEAQRLIREGRLPFVERRCRGGRIGTFIAREDAEAVFIGRKAWSPPKAQ